MKTRNFLIGASLLLFGAVGCADLNVTNQNNPDIDRVIKTPADLEGLIASSFNTWFDMLYDYDGLEPIMSVASFQHSAMAANFGMEVYGRIPRIAFVNQQEDAYAHHAALPWYDSYRVIVAVNSGLKKIRDEGVVINNASDTKRAETFAKFVQGLAHGTLALLYDSAYIYTEDINPEVDVLEAKPYHEVMAAALDMLDDAIALAKANSFTIPETWMGNSTFDNEKLAQLAHSFKARFRAQVARTPAERAAVDWNAVIADVDAGMKEDFIIVDDDVVWFKLTQYYQTLPGAWSQMNYFVLGMADISGRYQTWMQTPVSNRMPFVMVTPDKRFPQGATEAEQSMAANRGKYWEWGGTVGHVRDDRGTWRWSYYRNHTKDTWRAQFVGPNVHLSLTEMRLLKAEGLIRTNRAADAVPLINESRVAIGELPPVTVDGVPDAADCVPRLPNGQCGDLMEALKWEKRVETWLVVYGGWFFDGRGWGDLMEGTPLQFPIPAKERNTLGQPINTYGGVGGDGAAPVGNYGY